MTSWANVSECADDDRRRSHTHPMPGWLKLVLTVGSIGLLIFGSLTIYTLLQLGHLVDSNAQQRWSDCQQRTTNNQDNLVRTDQVLRELGNAQDPAAGGLRKVLLNQRDGYAKAAAVKCGPDPRTVR